MEKESRTEKIKAIWKERQNEVLENEGDLEFAFWELMIDFLPSEIVDDMEQKWTEVIPFDEEEIKGREVVDLPWLDEVMVLTKEMGRGGGYYAMWKKI